MVSRRYGQSVRKVCIRLTGKNGKSQEVVKVACPEVWRKGVRFPPPVSDCRGRGVAIHREESVKRGMPVVRDRQRCGGRGYERLPSTEAFNAI